jgi:ferritin-like protein
MTFGKDHRTYDLSLAILHEEIGARGVVRRVPRGRPPGHFRRGAPGESPYVKRFMTVDFH